jgi:hypothetical protein
MILSLLNRPDENKERQKIIIFIEIKGTDRRKRVERALLNSGTGANYIRQTLIIKAG